MRRASLTLLALLSASLLAGCEGGGLFRNLDADPGMPDGGQGSLDAEVTPEVIRDVPDAELAEVAGDVLDATDEAPRDLPDEASVDVPLDPIEDAEVPPVDVPRDEIAQDPGTDELPGDVPADTLPDGVECLRDADCADRVELETCQVAVCDDGKCAAALAEALTPCDDANACTRDDVCDAEGACAGTLITCKDTDPCTTDTCDPATGCRFVPYTGPCSDGNLCTGNDSCATGTCVGTTVDCNDDNACTSDGCAAATGCTYQKLNGGTCDDGDECSSGDTCVDGVCQGTGGCNDGNACTRDICTPGVGCSYEKLTGTACSDGNPCSPDDHCEDGTCIGFTNCDDGNPCTEDTCTATGCQHRETTAPCDDGDACTSGDTCSMGACVGTPYTCNPGDCEESAACDGLGGCTVVDKPNGTACTADAEQCTKDVCAAGECTHPAKTDGTSCDDGNLCTRTDACDSGVCVGGNPVTCTQTDPCQPGACDPATGTCTLGGKQEGDVCDDNNRCTQGETCHLGACTPATRTVCTALDPCHEVGTCNTSTGICSNPPKSDTSYCDDGDLCTRMDMCRSGVCTGLDPVACPVPDSCHEPGVCNPASGVCSNPPKPDGSECNDNVLCTREDQCTAGVCAGQAYSCNDGLTCTTDACDGVGCVNTVKPNYCVAGGACRTPFKVNPTNPCQVCLPDVNPNDWSNNPGPCTDNDLCTKNDSCIDGQCQGEAFSCGDDIECTEDLCDGAGGCNNPLKADSCRIDDICRVQNESNPANTCQRCWPSESQVQWSGRPEGDECNDGIACTTTDVCVSGTCTGTPYECDDLKDCTGDACDGRGGCLFTVLPGTCLIDGLCLSDGDTNPANVCEGCVHDNAPETWSGVNDGMQCNEGDACTNPGKCMGGVCEEGTSKCDDGISCTIDACTPEGACSNTLLAGWCVIDAVCAQAGEMSSTNPCLVCDPSTNPNGWSPLSGTACSDSNECTLDDVCVEGTCTGTPMDCSDGFGCTDDTCQAGVCLHAVQAGWCNIQGAGCFPNGAINPDNLCQKCDISREYEIWSPNDAGACDDRIACTYDDTCVEGTCQGTPYSCSDALTCTQDACDGLGGCTHTPNDGFCAIGESCWTAGDVNPVQPCLGCDPALDARDWSPRVGDVPCDDGEACTRDDLCVLGACAGSSYSCDDGLGCTADQCDGTGGCRNVISGAWCIIDHTCYEDQTPQPGNPCKGCIAAYQADTWSSLDGASCDDGSLATWGDLCFGGECRGIPYSCDDSLACTEDLYDGNGGCSHTQIAGTCLIDGACIADGAQDPANRCRKCDAVGAPHDWSANDGIPCDDNQGCTRDDVCSGKVCVGTPYSCGDANDCTLDMCDGVGGCANPLRPDVCVIDDVCYMAGAPKPDATCEACVPDKNQFGWTQLNADAKEVCNGADDNCNGLVDDIDENDPESGCTNYYADVDRDGYGVTSDLRCLCAPSAPYFALVPGDCDDNNADANPNPLRVETCNGFDDNCDGLTDSEDSIGCAVYFRDADGDTHGVAGDSRCLCAPKGVYQGLDNLECPDTAECGDSDVDCYLGAEEKCDGKDNNCDGLADPVGSTGCKTYYLDADGDGYGNSVLMQCRCSAARPYSALVPDDCDDSAATTNPSRSDICNGVDDDCSGYADDGLLTTLCPVPAGTLLHGDLFCLGSCQLDCTEAAGGEPAWWDTDQNYKTGCECQGDDYDASNHYRCDYAVDLGVLVDNEAQKLVVDANLAVPGLDDWYKVVATDATWDSEDGACDKYGFKARLVTNPEDAFAIDVRRGNCETSAQFCSGASEIDWATSFHSPDGGECLCSPADNPICETPADLGACIAEAGAQNCNNCPGVAAPGKNQCTDNSSTYYVRVYRKAGVAAKCAYYQLELSNGAYPFSP